MFSDSFGGELVGRQAISHEVLILCSVDKLYVKMACFMQVLFSTKQEV
jgi:hypothetical protein